MLNSHDEWSKLKEVIVGDIFHFKSYQIDLSFKLFFNDNAYMFWHKNNKGEILINEKYIDELKEDINELVSTLKSFGVKVHRPMRLKNVHKIKTPYWESTCVPALNVRDQAIVIGNEVIETPCCIRSRYFENDLLKPIFYEYFKKGSGWVSMPRPIMTDKSFDLSYAINKGFMGGQKTDFISEQIPHEFDYEQEMMIDAAQIIRFGKDLLVNVANRNHLLGYRWLKNYLEPKGYRLHRLRSIADNHIDSFIMPIAEGKLLLRNLGVKDKLPKWLQEWDILVPPEPKENWFPKYPSNQIYLTSNYIDLNVLSLDGKHIIVNSLCPELIDFLDKNGFIPIPVRHRHRKIFAGGFHCFTLDTVRE